jgi:hypothetical protein
MARHQRAALRATSCSLAEPRPYTWETTSVRWASLDEAGELMALTRKKVRR